MARWCRPDQIMQRSGAAAVHILIENLYELNIFAGKKLIREFSDKGWNVKGLNKLFKEVARFRFNDKTNGKRPTSQCAF